jgi:flagellar biosynthesis anti-sigma factor FlgM
MAITIDDSLAASGGLRSTPVGRPQEQQQDVQARQRPADKRDDSANLSSLSTELARALANEPPDVVSRVERLQEAVASGNFSVPVEEVAGSVINDALLGDELQNASVNLFSPPRPSAPPAPQ